MIVKSVVFLVGLVVAGVLWYRHEDPFLKNADRLIEMHKQYDNTVYS